MLLLAGATALPMLAIPLTGGMHPDQTAILSLAGLLGFFGGPAHVAMTSWFYTDPVAREHFRAHPWRYGFIPAALVVGTTAAYAIWQESQPTRWINFGFTVWLLWHYQKQNWGIHSFVTRVMSGGSASRLEEWIVRLAVVGGIVGGIRSAGFGGGTPVEAYAGAAFATGAAITLALPLLIAVALATVPALRAEPLRIASLCGIAAFFLPVFAFRNPNNAVLPYALAHGLQYAVFMSYVGRSTRAQKSEVWRPGLATMAVCLLAVGWMLRSFGNVGQVREWNLLPLFGLTLGVTMAHFVIDAGIWRLRDEFPRRYVGAAFPFLKPRTAGVAAVQVCDERPVADTADERPVAEPADERPVAEPAAERPFAMARHGR
ncbi:MAG TPA: hypothetical protein VM692_15035 [Gammaproteobacteria bacterium]|nr:hypothetical protein [Gammaproteobacteria bacterium]